MTDKWWFVLKLGCVLFIFCSVQLSFASVHQNDDLISIDCSFLSLLPPPSSPSPSPRHCSSSSPVSLSFLLSPCSAFHFSPFTLFMVGHVMFTVGTTINTRPPGRYSLVCEVETSFRNVAHDMWRNKFTLQS